MQDLAEEKHRCTPLKPAEVMQHGKKRISSRSVQFTLYKAGECEDCEGAGYRGRMGVYEFLEATGPIRVSCSIRRRWWSCRPRPFMRVCVP